LFENFQPVNIRLALNKKLFSWQNITENKNEHKSQKFYHKVNSILPSFQILRLPNPWFLILIFHWH